MKYVSIFRPRYELSWVLGISEVIESAVHDGLVAYAIKDQHIGIIPSPKDGDWAAFLDKEVEFLKSHPMLSVKDGQ